MLNSFICSLTVQYIIAYDFRSWECITICSVSIIPQIHTIFLLQLITWFLNSFRSLLSSSTPTFVHVFSVSSSTLSKLHSFICINSYNFQLIRIPFSPFICMDYIFPVLQTKPLKKAFKYYPLNSTLHHFQKADCKY